MRHVRDVRRSASETNEPAAASHSNRARDGVSARLPLFLKRGLEVTRAGVDVNTERDTQGHDGEASTVSRRDVMQHRVGDEPVARQIGRALGRDMGSRGAAAEREASHAAAAVGRGERPIISETGGPPVARRWESSEHEISRASDLICNHTSWGNLNEIVLGRDLAERARVGELSFVNQVLDELGWFNRDDVGVEVLRALTDPELDGFIASPSARAFLHRLYDLVTAGNLAAEEMAEADRVIHAELRVLPASEWDRQAATAPVIPYGEPGILAFGESPVMAERRSGGRIWVRFTLNWGYSQLTREEAQRTPLEYVMSGVELPARQIVVIKQLDDGGRYEPRPALYLLQIANQTDTATAEAVGTAVVGGLSLGVGGLAMGGGRAATSVLVRVGMSASTAARVLTVLDAAAMSIGVVTQLIHDNRGWIISQFGDSGRRFVSANDVVGNAVMVYGLTRLVVEMPQTIAGFRDAYRQWRTAKASVNRSLDMDQLGTANEVERQTDAFLAQVDEVEAVKTGNRIGLSDEIPEHTKDTKPKGLEDGAIETPEAISIETKEHVHQGGIETDLRSAYNGKWDGSGIHNWDTLVKTCKRDGYTIKDVLQDPSTGVRRVTIERTGVDPKTKVAVKGTIRKTIYPQEMAAAEIDAAGESAFQKAKTQTSGTKFEGFGTKRNPDGTLMTKIDGTPVDGYFEATVDTPVGGAIRIQGWYRTDPDGKPVISSHAPRYDKAWPSIEPSEW